MTRAVELLGIGSNNLRDLPIDEARRLRPNALAEALDRDLAAGILPVAVVATAGTTLTGAIDPLDEIADVCAERGVWLHVDGAYGVPAASVPTHAPLFRGLERADSILGRCAQMAVPAEGMRGGPGARARAAHASVRARGGIPAPPAVRAARGGHHARVLAAVPCLEAVAGVPGARGTESSAKVICAGPLGGRPALRHRSGGRRLRNHGRAAADLDVPFRHTPPGVGDLDAHNDALAKAIQMDGRVYLASALIDDHVWVRPCFVNFRTTEEDVRAIVDVARELGEPDRRKKAAGREGRAASGRTQGPRRTRGAAARLPRDVGRLQPVPRVGRDPPAYGSEGPRRRPIVVDGVHRPVGAVDLGRDGDARLRRGRRHQPADRDRRHHHARRPEVRAAQEGRARRPHGAGLADRGRDPQDRAAVPAVQRGGGRGHVAPRRRTSRTRWLGCCDRCIAPWSATATEPRFGPVGPNESGFRFSPSGMLPSNATTRRAPSSASARVDWWLVPGPRGRRRPALAGRSSCTGHVVSPGFLADSAVVGGLTGADPRCRAEVVPAVGRSHPRRRRT